VKRIAGLALCILVAAASSTPAQDSANAPLTIDLGATRTVRALMIQGEHDDAYLIEGSPDGVAWLRLTVARAAEGGGLRSRAIRLRGDALVRQLRDHRTDDVMPIDRALLDALASLREKLETDQPFHVISGYRSPATNARLAAASDGVARKSLHLQGRAIDIRVPGRSLEQVRSVALAMKSGGVGYYRRSGFVHLDTGRVRSW